MARDMRAQRSGALEEQRHKVLKDLEVWSEDTRRLEG
jgi:hypothetical protein